MAMLAKGLKKRFETYASACIPALLEKFKEKKQNVVLPLRDAVDAIYLSVMKRFIIISTWYKINKYNIIIIIVLDDTRIYS